MFFIMKIVKVKENIESNRMWANKIVNNRRNLNDKWHEMNRKKRGSRKSLFAINISAAIIAIVKGFQFAVGLLCDDLLCVETFRLFVCSKRLNWISRQIRFFFHRAALTFGWMSIISCVLLLFPTIIEEYGMHYIRQNERKLVSIFLPLIFIHFARITGDSPNMSTTFQTISQNFYLEIHFEANSIHMHTSRIKGKCVFPFGAYE